MHRLLLAMLVSGVASTYAFANEGSIRAEGGAVTALRPHPTIEMKSERVVARLTLDTATVDCTFVLHNTGPATTVTLGFPQSGSGDTDPEERRFLRFETWVDGKPAIARKHVDRTGRDYRYWWVKRVRFSRGQTRVIRDRYTARLGETLSREVRARIEEMKLPSSKMASRRVFQYVTATGASWKGRIGRAEFMVDLSGLPGLPELRCSPPGYSRANNRLTWIRTDFEPGDRDPIWVMFLPPHRVR